jgi:transposase-like protein
MPYIHSNNRQQQQTVAIWRVVNDSEVFPNVNAAMKVIYLAVEAASKKWSSCPWGTMPIRDWKAASNRFMIEFEEQLAPHV